MKIFAVCKSWSLVAFPAQVNKWETTVPSSFYPRAVLGFRDRLSLSPFLLTGHLSSLERRCAAVFHHVGTVGRRNPIVLRNQPQRTHPRVLCCFVLDHVLPGRWFPLRYTTLFLFTSNCRKLQVTTYSSMWQSEVIHDAFTMCWQSA